MCVLLNIDENQLDNIFKPSHYLLPPSSSLPHQAIRRTSSPSSSVPADQVEAGHDSHPDEEEGEEEEVELGFAAAEGRGERKRKLLEGVEVGIAEVGSWDRCREFVGLEDWGKIEKREREREKESEDEGGGEVRGGEAREGRRRDETRRRMWDDSKVNSREELFEQVSISTVGLPDTQDDVS